MIKFWKKKKWAMNDLKFSRLIFYAGKKQQYDK